MTVPGTSPAERIAHLRATLTHGSLPETQKKRGIALLERLTSPVRLTLLGLPDSGKSELVNLLLGRRVLPTGQGMPTCRLVWGAEWKCTATDHDGSVSTLKWPVPEGFDWSNIVFVKLFVPLDLLKSVSILEVVSDGSPENLEASVRWAVANSDMAIWCTQSMTRQELALWRQVPDTLKDHSFLALPKADLLAAEGVLPERIGVLGAIAEEEFYGLYPVATLQYLSALTPGAPVEARVRAASGAGALIDAVLGDLRRGRQADLDGAEIFLSRYGIAQIPDEPAPTPASEVPSPRPAVRRKTVTLPPPAAGGPKPRPEEPSETPRETRRNSELLASATAKKPEPKPDPKPAAKAPAPARGLDAALRDLKAMGQELAALGEAGSADEILTLCAARFEDLVVDLPPGGGTLADEIEAASEAMILMQLEGDESSAADAVTVVLQLTRELEFAQAA